MYQCDMEVGDICDDQPMKDTSTDCEPMDTDPEYEQMDTDPEIYPAMDIQHLVIPCRPILVNGRQTTESKKNFNVVSSLHVLLFLLYASMTIRPEKRRNIVTVS